MNTSKPNFEIVSSAGCYFIHQNGSQLLSPNGNPLFLDKKELTMYVLEELNSENSSEGTTASLYSMCCTYVDYGYKLEEMPLSAFQEYIMNDPVITAGEGPEKFHQVAKWASYLQYLDKYHLQHPDLAPSKETEQLKSQMQARGRDFVQGLDKFMDHFYSCFGKVNLRAKVAAMKAIELYKAPVLGMLLVKGTISPIEFAEGVLAGLMILPEVRSDISAAKYQVYAAHISKDANLMQSFAQ